MHFLWAIAQHSLWEIALGDYPPVPSQGKILNVLRGDREALPTGDREALLTGDCEALPLGDRS
ncbi:hypothetical protein [Cylindrospermopsis raciborskii]|uniref:hypothetical protein n=1 Tax=Cylindrospermopsis raciborskii TaxID=77022 RepID=UPI0015E0A997|nr:hypothetical protein [Cylindrospermopsis raciborskii]